MDQRQVVIFDDGSPYSCWRVKRLFRRRGYAFRVVEVAELSSERDVRATLVPLAGPLGRRAVPQVFVDGRLVGGFADVSALDRAGNLDRLVRGEV